jgi:hypothetical protein
MEARLEQRIIIKFLSIEGRTADKIRTRLLLLYGEDIYALVIIYKWICEFRTWRTSIFDQLRSGRPSINRIDADILYNVTVAKLLKTLWPPM